MCPGYHSEGQACIRRHLQALIWGSGYHFRIVLHLTSLRVTGVRASLRV